MTPELASAFARETVDAIRRANTPILGSIVQLRTSVAAVTEAAVTRSMLDHVQSKLNGDLDALNAAIHELNAAFDAKMETLRVSMAALGSMLTTIEATIGGMVQREVMDGVIAATSDELSARIERGFADIDSRLGALLDQRVEPALAKLAEQRGPPGDGFRYREVFVDDAEYTVGDWVTHDGTLWAAIAPSKGLTPGTPAAAVVWRMALKRPRDGANGIGWNWRGNFSADESYRLNDVVRHSGRVFLCRRSTNYSPPDIGGGSAEWAVVLE
jgi:hypothetical protein